jgi:glycosyltransferase involved in cell wall biosynthesis
LSPLVSIIIPIYNRFECAQRAIESVMGQTYTNWELLIVDDCSEVAFELDRSFIQAQNRVDFYRNLENSGPGISRQVGLDNAIGDYVCFLDSDDYYHEEFLVKMLKTLEENSDCSGAYCTSFDIVENLVRRSSNVSFDKIMPTLFDEHRPWATCSWLWRRESLPKWTNERSNEDSLFEINVAMNNNKIVHVNEVLCYIDKGTGENTIDLLGSSKNELDRNKVVQYCILNLSKFKSDQKEIGEGCLRRVLFVSARLVKIDNLSLVKENIHMLRQYSFSKTFNRVANLLKLGIMLVKVDVNLSSKIIETIGPKLL